MPLDSSTISPTAKARLRNSAFGLYGSIAHVIGLAADPLNAGLPTYTPGMYLPLLKSYYSPTTDFGKKIDYNNKLTQLLGSRDYGIFSHASGGNASDCYYAVIKNFIGSHRLSVLYKDPTVVANNSVKFMDYIRTQNSNSYYYASTGPFHVFVKGAVVNSDEKTMGVFYKNDVRFDSTIKANPLTASIQFDLYSSTSNTFVFKDMSRDPNIPQIGVTGGDGFGTLVPFLSPITGLLRDGYFSKIGRDPGNIGIAILAYNIAQDLLFSIVRKHGASIDIDEIADMLEVLEFTDAVFCDGSDSVFIADYESPADARLLIGDLPFYKNYASGGLKLAFAIKKQP
jgi:hypothetical protein